VWREVRPPHNLEQPAETPRSVAVIGAGFLGLAATATFTELGLPVTMIDPDPEPLASRVGHAVASRLIAFHRKHGVDVRCGTLVHSIGSAGGQASQVVLSTGDVVDADLILVAVGATPAVGWLRDSGRDR
jgi:3-phenylpropionate/trans-cinnamate dioxygenase ferredoxin reductase component